MTVPHLAEQLPYEFSNGPSFLESYKKGNYLIPNVNTEQKLVNQEGESAYQIIELCFLIIKIVLWNNVQ